MVMKSRTLGFILLIAVSVLSLSCSGRDQQDSPDKKGQTAMDITKEVFGTLPDGREVQIFALKNSLGITVRIMNYGATVMSLEVPEQDQVAGFEGASVTSISIS